MGIDYKMKLARLEEVYDLCVEETGNPDAYHDRIKSKKLSALLSVLEYIQGYSDENPLNEIF